MFSLPVTAWETLDAGEEVRLAVGFDDELQERDRRGGEAVVEGAGLVWDGVGVVRGAARGMRLEAVCGGASVGPWLVTMTRGGWI